MTRVHAAFSETYSFCNASTYTTPGLHMVESRAFRRVTCGRCLQLIAIKRERRLRLPRKRHDPTWFFQHPAEEIRDRYSDLFTHEYAAIQTALSDLEDATEAPTPASKRRATMLRKRLAAMIADVPCRCDCFDTPCGCRRCLPEAEIA